jgi:hypothetical protein
MPGLAPITPPTLGYDLGVVKIGVKNIGTFLIGEHTVAPWLVPAPAGTLAMPSAAAGTLTLVPATIDSL